MKEMNNKRKALLAVVAAVVIAVIILVLSLIGCQQNNTATPDEATSTLTTETSPQQEATEEVTTIADKVIAEQGLTVNEQGEVVDNNGNKVEKNEYGTYTVKTEAGETVKVTAEEVKKAPVNNNENTDNKPANNTKPTTKPNNNNNNNTSSTTSKVDNNKPVNSNTNTDNNKKPDTNTSSNTGTNTSSNTNTKTWHEAEYKYVNHPAQTKTEKVWVVDKEAYTYEEPVYEKHGRTICNDCGMDITDYNVRKEHLIYEITNGGKGSYHNTQTDVQVGTKTVEVPEEGHWETKTTVIKEAWTEKVLVREAGYY